MSGSRFSNRRLFIAGGLILLLAFQGILSFATSPEPYPTIRMPGFGTAPDRDGTFTTTKESISIGYSGGRIVNVDAQDLMTDFRYSSMRPSMNFEFKPSKDGTPVDLGANIVNWLRHRAFDLGDGSTPEYIEFTWQPVRVNVVDVQTTPVGEPQITRVQL